MATNKKNEFLYALKSSTPIIFGYFVVSSIFGIGCIKLGLPLWLPVLMSILVYAGAAQFSFLVLFSTNASITTIVITTFLINLRHMLMSIYMSNVFDQMNLKKTFRWFYGHGLTDESFAFHSSIKDANLSHKYFLYFNFLCHSTWILGSLFGALLITEVKDIANIKLEYALTAMMIYVLVMLITDRTKIVVALVSIVAMILLSTVYDSTLNIFLATFIGCGVGVWLKKRN